MKSALMRTLCVEKQSINSGTIFEKKFFWLDVRKFPVDDRSFMKPFYVSPIKNRGNRRASAALAAIPLRRTVHTIYFRPKTANSSTSGDTIMYVFTLLICISSIASTTC